MKYRRHKRILDIISENEISTQWDLAERLRIAGEEVTQATVSRDIKDLGLIKVPASDGKQKYALTTEHSVTSQRLIRVFQDTVLSIEYSGNLVLLLTFSGGANAAAEVVDGLGWKEILGTLAGDNTIMIVVREGYSSAELTQKLRALLR